MFACMTECEMQGKAQNRPILPLFKYFFAVFIVFYCPFGLYIPITASNFGTFYLNQLNNYISPLSLERHKEKTILFFRR